MNKTIGLLLVGYSLLLTGLSYFVHHLAAGVAQPTLITGLAGGTLCLAWGLRAVAGSGGEALPILKLIPVNFALLTQTFMGWSGGSGGLQAGRTVAVVITLLLVLSMGMLLRIARAGVVFDVQPGGPPKEGGTKSQTTGNPTTQTNASKRA